MIAGTDGWIREKKSRNRLPKSGGDALSLAVRSGAMGPEFYRRRFTFPQRPEIRNPALAKKAAICANAPRGASPALT